MRPLTASIVVVVLVLTQGGCLGLAANAGASGQGARLGQILDSADENHDGVITRAEFQNARARLFARLDHNGDGFVDKSDASGGPLRRRKIEEVLSRVVALTDKDGDGRVSRQEFIDGPALIFDRADTNHDGVVDAQELAPFQAKAASR
jgi:Ca2+-binding EF-hand superfamily protein